MSGGTAAHARIQRNPAISVGGRLARTRCEFFGSDIEIEVAGFAIPTASSFARPPRVTPRSFGIPG